MKFSPEDWSAEVGRQMEQWKVIPPAGTRFTGAMDGSDEQILCLTLAGVRILLDRKSIDHAWLHQLGVKPVGVFPPKGKCYRATDIVGLREAGITEMRAVMKVMSV